MKCKDTIFFYIKNKKLEVENDFFIKYLIMSVKKKYFFYV
jgi:hypothetical protein